MNSQNFSQLFQSWVNEYFERSASQKNFVELLFKSQEYSFKQGGKRFRPYLAATVFQIWQQDLNQIKNFCLAVEMIHTYSLIHDDLPCMDNDDFRRGIPTNHKVFNEDIALLAGDSLLTEAFHLIASDKLVPAEARVQALESLSDRAGSFGMVGGQVLDMKATKSVTLPQLQQIHEMKTGCLIQAAALGAAQIAQANPIEQKAIADFSYHLGIAFQIKDDLLDIADNAQDFKNYVAVIGKDETIKQLNHHSEQALASLQTLNSKSAAVNLLRELIETNQKRIV
jgi:geranylgeranyl diphosphate synthase, type II